MDFPRLIRFGYEFEFSPISKHWYGTGNGEIGTHLELILKPVPNVENQFFTPFYLNRNSKSKLFHSHSQSLSVTYTLICQSSLSFPSISHNLDLSLLYHHSHQSPFSICWIMHYNIASGVEKKIKNIIHSRDGDVDGIPELVGDGDGIQFLIPVKYRSGNG